MKNSYLIAAVLLFCISVAARAQSWSVGVKGGPGLTSISQSYSGRIDESYSAVCGFDAGIQARYAFTGWFAVRADLSFMSRSYRMDRNLQYLEPVYTKNTNSFITLPVMADFSFGGNRLRGHAYFGGYGAYWISARREGTTFWMTDYYVYFEDFREQRQFNDEDQRLIAGAVGGFGLSYSLGKLISKNDILGIDVLYYYGLVSHHKGYTNLSDPRYFNTLSITLSWAFSF